jgi:O-antigen ligase
MLSETGIIGTTLFIAFLILIYKFFLKNITQINIKNKFISYALTISFTALIWPISTSGSFFTTWNGSFYWLILGLLISNQNLILSKK